jgi:hypothetical protein
MPQLYHPTLKGLTVSGQTFETDENGIVNVPDDKMNASVFSMGFVLAKARLAQLAAEDDTAIDLAPDPNEPGLTEHNDKVAPPSGMGGNKKSSGGTKDNPLADTGKKDQAPQA